MKYKIELTYDDIACKWYVTLREFYDVEFVEFASGDFDYLDDALDFIAAEVEAQNTK